jgi:hypothetical protein
MKWPKEWRENTWVWLGIIALSLLALWWLLLGLAIMTSPKSTTAIIIFGLIVSVVPIITGVYCLRRGRRVKKIRAARFRLDRKGVRSTAGEADSNIRDQVRSSLRAIGLEAHLSKRGRAEEKTGHRSLGLIEVSAEPIGWVNVRNVSTFEGGASYLVDFGITDHRLRPDAPDVRIHSAYVKSFPILGRVIGLRWKGDDLDSGVIARLNDDSSIKEPILSTVNVTISAHGRYGCWTISPDVFMAAPSPELWKCYRTIAQHLLE